MEIHRAKRSASREISMIPLINLVFLLLIFFLVSGTIEKFDIIPIELPVAESGKILDEGHIVIVVGRYNEIILNDEFITFDGLHTVLSNHFKQNPDKIITIKADSSIESFKLIRIMDAVKAAGGTHLSLVTQSLES